jgi:hypothetical protein
MRSALLISVVLVGAQLSALAGEALDLRVTTDRSIDPSSIRTVVKSVCKPGMTEEEKAIALWKTFNTCMFHWDRIARGKWENIATYGYSLCGTMWRTYSIFYPAEFGDGSVRGGGLGNKVDSRGIYHLVMRGWLADSYLINFVGKGYKQERLAEPPDPSTLYLPERTCSGGHTMGEVKFDGKWHFMDMHAGFWVRTADGRDIAPLSVVLGDPTLVTDPVGTDKRFMPCDSGAPWFFYRASGGARGRGSGKKTDEVHPTNLRAGLRYVRYYGKTFPKAFVYQKSWEKCPKWYAEKGPRHLCNGEEGWRHFGNGEVVFEPERTELWREALAASENLAADTKEGLRGADATKPWSLTVKFRTPYVFVSGHAGGRSNGKVSIAVKGAKGDTPVWNGAGDIKADMLKKVSGGKVTVVVKGEAGSSVRGLRIAPVFQYNYFLSPRPKPGANKVKVTWSPKSDMKDRAVRVTWTWKEKAGPKKHEKVIAESGTEYDLPLGQVDVPKGAELNPTYIDALTVEVVKN